MYNSDTDISKLAKEVIEKEASAVANLKNYIDKSFTEISMLIFKSKGRLVITGIGKSAIIANKIVATMNSTGTPAIFMHAADAIHGDLGIIQPEDIVIFISKSGNTPEIKVLVPLIRKMGNTLIAMVSNIDSYLANHANFILRTTVDDEACPNNLAPTSSTTAQMVMGDALAVTLLKLKGFTQQDFAKLHPGGSLGKRLYTRVADLIDRRSKPSVSLNENIQNTIMNISANRLGATVVLDENGVVSGIITDGDVRRMLERGFGLDTLQAKDIMSSKPKMVDATELAVMAFNIMEQNKITSVIVTERGKYIGLVHIHDIIREGIV
ncbi:MAG: D-arabinose 5-phosphate isomerase [Bacteroidetes bacterium GWF2_41_61]|nr:MAG: D-arabinose 5-phosphate isomerase [Bacteroidetes bacterium GWE2_40_15]OFY27624.1 MAG: D-arabinose 5-phosphate isomerase [Bacteroidetes bacterium GWF2_41_61]HBG25114.1 D-arabinose 5-phosphate isomerase [Rikenellaceae bacterium]HBZ24797.1 D-arabinose 5-phosphate isomerase [Rikenellaceae bacterium]